jgi:hypothetical protein
MQELLLDDMLLKWARQGKKTGTSRKGRRDIQLAPLKLVATNGTEASLVVGVKSVTHTRLRDIPDEIVKSEGYESLEDLIETLKKFYPDCQLDDEFTLIEW